MNSMADVLAAFKLYVIQPTGIEAYDHLPDSPNFPAAFPYVEEWPYDWTDNATVVIWCGIGATDTQDAQSQISGWLSDEGELSFVAAIDSDPTLGGVVSSVLPVTARNIRPSALATGQRVWEGELVCQVLR